MPRLTFISRMTIKPGREQDYVRACRELTEKVRANEPEVVYYEFFKLREPRRYAVHAHMNSPWLAALAPAIIDCIDGTWEREYLDPFEA
jgi:(4S)-4-hydroxy-5-phosphonooxypentane-2,3-dione isomerase